MLNVYMNKNLKIVRGIICLVVYPEHVNVVWLYINDVVNFI